MFLLRRRPGGHAGYEQGVNDYTWHIWHTWPPDVSLMYQAIPLVSHITLVTHAAGIDNAIDVLYTLSKTELKYFSIPNQ